MRKEVSVLAAYSVHEKVDQISAPFGAAPRLPHPPLSPIQTPFVSILSLVEILIVCTVIQYQTTPDDRSL